MAQTTTTTTITAADEQPFTPLVEKNVKSEPTAPTPQSEEPERSHLLGNIILTLIILAIVGGVVYYVGWYNADEDEEETTVGRVTDDIVPATDTNTAPVATSPSAETPAPTTTTPTTSATTTVATAPSEAVVASETTSVPAAVPSAPATKTYQSAALGVTLTIPGTWLTDDQQIANSVVIYAAKTDTYGLITSYNNLNGETLDSLEAMLKQSPNATGLSRTTAKGLPAIMYTSTATNKKNLVLIANNKIYYLEGEAAENTVLDKLTLQ